MNKKIRRPFKKVWHFIWEDNSIWSWIANVILAFILIKFIVYPGLGLLLNTSYPVVAVVSSSMEHRTVKSCAENNIIAGNAECSSYKYAMCGKAYGGRQSFSLDDYWDKCGEGYRKNGIEKADFSKFPYRNGFNKGDIMVLRGVKPEKISRGDVIVFFSKKKDPIIHRVVNKNEKDNKVYLHTKGDNNEDSIKNNLLDETKITEEILIGKAIARIPLLGYIKIVFVRLLQALGI